MSPELKEALVDNLKDAKTPEETDKAVVLAICALCDCQCKTAARVKSLAWKLAGILILIEGAGKASSIIDWLKAFI